MSAIATAPVDRKAQSRPKKSIAPREVAASDEARIARIAGTLAHELKNPLASVVTNLAVASELCDDHDPRKSFLDRAGTDLERVNTLLRACLDLACAERIHRKPVELSTWFGRFEAEDVEIELEGLHATTAFVDPVLLERAIENLLDNARQASEDASALHVRISPRIEADQLVVVVEDDGDGIPPALQQNLFEPLVSGRQGSGLGLAFVRRVCRAHGGDAWLVDPSEAPSSVPGGARFVLRIPTNEGA